MTADTSPVELADGKLIVDRPGDGVVRLTISNPAKRNALDHPILDAITASLQELAGEARCLMITGAHGMFSAGYDIGEIPAEEFEERAERLVAHPFTEAIDALERFPYPTLAVLPGHTIGGGLELALSCDLRVAQDGIKLGMPPAKLGLVYSHTGLRRFLDAIGAARTRELFLLGQYIDVDTALQWGLVTRVSPPERLEQLALEIALELAGNAPLSQVGNKRVIAALLAAEGSLAGEVEEELIELRRASFASRDMREGMRAFAERRAPRWQNEERRTLAQAGARIVRTGAGRGPAAGEPSPSPIASFACSRRSGAGDHQFHSPSSAISAGTSSARITNASIKTAAAVPSPSSLMKTTCEVANAPRATATMIAPAVTTRPVCCKPAATASRLASPRSWPSLIRVSRNTP
jgi:enoyl-CoA hydratase/carnithine racemase